MANRTAGQVLSQVDALLPNQYTLEEKRRWLQQAEGFVCEEILHETLGETFSDETELRVPPLADDLRHLRILERHIQLLRAVLAGHA